jgi:DNA-binding transcriptional ArsR family regulator
MQSQNNTIEIRILDLLSDEILSTSEVAKRINMRREVVSGYLEALRNQGKLEKIRVGRSNVYRTISNSQNIFSLKQGKVSARNY